MATFEMDYDIATMTWVWAAACRSCRNKAMACRSLERLEPAAVRSVVHELGGEAGDSGGVTCPDCVAARAVGPDLVVGAGI